MNFFEADIYNFSLDAFNRGVRSTVMPTLLRDSATRGTQPSKRESGVKAHFNEWDPRVGFAWDVTGDGRTAVRAGVGMGHDYIHTRST